MNSSQQHYLKRIPPQVDPQASGPSEQGWGGVGGGGVGWGGGGAGRGGGGGGGGHHPGGQSQEVAGSECLALPNPSTPGP